MLEQLREITQGRPFALSGYIEVNGKKIYPSEKRGIHLRPLRLKSAHGYLYDPSVRLVLPDQQPSNFRVPINIEKQQEIFEIAAAFSCPSDIALAGAVISITPNNALRIEPTSRMSVIPAWETNINPNESFTLVGSANRKPPIYGDLRIYQLGSPNVRYVVTLPSQGLISLQAGQLGFPSVKDAFLALTGKPAVLGIYSSITREIIEHRIRELFNTLSPYAQSRGETWSDQTLNDILELREDMFLRNAHHSIDDFEA